MLILDKSALQSFSLDEAVWLDLFFATNITPLLYVETLADLTVTDKKGRKGEDIVADIASKTPVNGTFPNVHHNELIKQDLMGNAVSMTNRPVVTGGTPKKDPDGKIGFHFDQFPEQTAMDRWYKHEFQEIERGAAQSWRDALKNLDFEPTMRWVMNTVPSGTRFNSLLDVKNFVDNFVSQQGDEQLEFMLQLLGVPARESVYIRARYEKLGKPPLSEFAPYAAFVLKIEMFFYICVERDFISKDRASNKADIAYLYYLPFCNAFVSGDKLHIRTAELFMEHGQRLVKAQDLKSALKELDDFYITKQDEIERVGLMRYVGYPPVEVSNLVSEMWDQFMRPDWRDVEDERGEKESKYSEDPELGKKLKKQYEESETTELPEDPDAVDFVTIERTHSVRKGKWRMLPPEFDNPNSVGSKKDQ